MSGTLDVKFFTIAFIIYIAAFAFFLVRSGSQRNSFGWAGVWALGIGAVAQLIAFFVRWNLAGHIPLSSMHSYASIMSWMASVSLAVLVARTRRFDLGTFIAPLIIAIMAIASLLPTQIHQQLVPALQSYWLHIHVSMAALSEGAFAVSCGLSIYYLIKQRRSGVDPAELTRIDMLNHRAISIGYPLFTLGALFAGAIWAYDAWGSFWSWDPKEVGSLIIWLFYTGYLHARYQRGWRGRRAAILAIIGFAMVILSFLGNLFLGGQHSYENLG
ncbi:c-type cytochrome biogenesis protein CcsB [Candidatus Eisenbacteria bacterium]|uniref:Heme exporter protein C n=1 Tax=Eiseniibacteriota bacterium TaxID=2212470 RepID=A0ABV6YIT3_UNCEI